MFTVEHNSHGSVAQFPSDGHPCLERRVQTFRAERDFSSRIMALRENFVEKHLWEKSRTLRDGGGFGNREPHMGQTPGGRRGGADAAEMGNATLSGKHRVCDGNKAER